MTSDWRPETLDPSNGTVICYLQKSLYGLRTNRDAGKTIWSRSSGSEASSRTCWTLACGHTTKQVSLVFHVDDLLSAGTHQIIKGSLTELSRDLELKSSEVTTKPTRYLGRTQSSTRPRSHCDGNAVRQMRRRYACTRTKSPPTSLLGNVD